MWPDQPVQPRLQETRKVSTRQQKFAQKKFYYSQLNRAIIADPAKSSLGRQQLQYQHRTRYASTTVNLEEKNQKNTKRKRYKNEQDQNERPTKQKGPNWTERQLLASNFRNLFFESVLNEPPGAKVVVDVAMRDSGEISDGELLPEEATVEWLNKNSK